MATVEPAAPVVPGIGWPRSGEGVGVGEGLGIAPGLGWPVVRGVVPGQVEASFVGVGVAPVGDDVSRETAETDDDATPLATAVEYSLKVRQGLEHREPLPRPARTRVMVVANQKGGVGKTTTTVNVAAGLAQHGLRVLVIDLDPQGNASTALGIEHRRGTPSTYDALVDGVPLTEVVHESAEIPGLYVVPATIDLAGAEIELVSVVARENRLRKAILGHPFITDEGPERLDYVLIDCPPSLGLLTLNALVAAEELLLPIQTEYYALEGVGQLLETVELVRANLNPRLTISTVLLTMFDGRTRLSAAVADEVREHFGDRVLKTAIPRSVRVSEAPSYGQTVMTYDPASPGALSYLEAARELSTKGVQG
jgi:chromosome partitioning protein